MSKYVNSNFEACVEYGSDSSDLLSSHSPDPHLGFTFRPHVRLSTTVPEVYLGRVQNSVSDSAVCVQCIVTANTNLEVACL